MNRRDERAFNVFLGSGLTTLLVLILGVAVIVFAFVFAFYANPVSQDPANWGQVGDYFGGFLNPIFSCATLIVTIYIAILARSIQQDEQAAFSQPFLYVRTTNAFEDIEISIENFGAGVATNIQFALFNEKQENLSNTTILKFLNFGGGIRKRLEIDGFENQPPPFLPPGRKLILFKLQPGNRTIPAHHQLVEDAFVRARENLAKLTLRISYKSVFGAEMDPVECKLGERFGD